MSAQTSEQFIYLGKIYQGVYCEPLSGYLHENNLSEVFVGISSTCWRGYHGTWKIFDGKLYLINFSGSIRIPKEEVSLIPNSLDFLIYEEPTKFDLKWVGLDYLFPNQNVVFAKWYSGEVKLVKKIKLTGDDHFDTIYPKETFLKFKDGMLIESNVIRNHISFRERIPSYIKQIFESDYTASVSFKQRLHSLLLKTLYTVIVLPFVILQMLMISIEYIYDTITYEMNKGK